LKEALSKDNQLSALQELYNEEKRFTDDIGQKSEIEKSNLCDELSLLKAKMTETIANSQNLGNELSVQQIAAEKGERELASKSRLYNDLEEKFNIETKLRNQQIETEKELLNNELKIKNDELAELKKLFVLKDKNEDNESKLTAIWSDKKIDDLRRELLASDQYSKEVNKSFRNVMRITEVIKNALKDENNKKGQNEILVPNDFYDDIMDDNSVDSSDTLAALKVKDMQLLELHQKLAAYAQNQMEIKSAWNENQMTRDHLLESLKAKERQILLLSQKITQYEIELDNVYMNLNLESICSGDGRTRNYFVCSTRAG
jgi:hypothetical protein